MVTAFDIKELFNTQFGFRPPANYTIEQQGKFTQSSGPGGFQIDAAPPEQITGKLGGKYWEKDVYGREYFMPVYLNEVALWFPVISVIELNRQVVETDMVERSGSVKEIISIDDIVINVKGLIVGINNQWPEQEFTQLCELFALNKSVPIKSVITDIAFNRAFGQGTQDAHMVVIKRVPITPKVGVKHVIPYEMNLISDTIFELEIL
jgi:Domain of unknown function (DUF6046)